MVHSLQPSPDQKVLFDGNAVDLERVLAHVQLQFMLTADASADDSQKAAVLASHFRGAALDWVTRALNPTGTANIFGNYDGFVASVKRAFFLDQEHVQAQAQTELAALKQGADMLEFLQRFDHLCERAGCRSDVTPLTLLFPKLSKRYHDMLISGGATFVHYSVARNCLVNIVDREAPMKQDDDTRRRKARCKICGKRGHTGTQCTSKN